MYYKNIEIIHKFVNIVYLVNGVVGVIFFRSYVIDFDKFDNDNILLELLF
ncbi:hypothetical protein HanIR_Chr06g0255871 [Helianthus annuus]|nr:hypothetical protein HanIR_Chr06g0255871 [Helianthus annuus]